MRTLLEAVDGLRGPSSLSVIGGDFNSTPGSAIYRYVRGGAAAAAS